MQDSKLKTFNMYDSAQTNIVNIFAGKERREGWAGLIYAYGKAERDGHRRKFAEGSFI